MKVISGREWEDEDISVYVPDLNLLAFELMMEEVEVEPRQRIKNRVNILLRMG
ncbi:MAG: hypothetical protein KBC84_07960 [Proteobacteria bacterium]|nr:hypothetical protein [Pseudomonadota bacterium]